MVKRDMVILVIGVIAGAVAAGICPMQSICPKLF